jgi:hypothetical protein
MPLARVLSGRSVEEVSGWRRALGLRFAAHSPLSARRAEALRQRMRVELANELASQATSTSN